MIALFSLLVSLWLSPAPFFSPSSSVPPLFVTPPSCLAFVPPSLSLACCVHKSHALSRHTHTHTKSTKNANAHGRSFANTADMHGNECFFTIIQTERKTIKHTHTLEGSHSCSSSHMLSMLFTSSTIFLHTSNRRGTSVRRETQHARTCR